MRISIWREVKSIVSIYIPCLVYLDLLLGISLCLPINFVTESVINGTCHFEDLILFFHLVTILRRNILKTQTQHNAWP